MGDKKFFDKNFNSRAAQIAGEEISKIDSCDVIPPVQMLQILRVLNERRRQDEKWGEQNHNDYYWLGILGEEFGEAAKALIENALDSREPYQPTVADPFVHEVLQRRETADLEKELLHVAAVAVAWLEAIERRKAGR